MEDRKTRRAILHTAVDNFLDHLEEDFDEKAVLGGVVIAGEIYVDSDDPADGESTVVPTYWASNENGIWQRGFFEILADYKRIVVVPD